MKRKCSCYLRSQERGSILLIATAMLRTLSWSSGEEEDAHACQEAVLHLSGPGRRRSCCHTLSCRKTHGAFLTVLSGVLPVPGVAANLKGRKQEQHLQNYSHLAQFFETPSLSTVIVSHYHQLTKQMLSLKFASFVMFLPSSTLAVFVK